MMSQVPQQLQRSPLREDGIVLTPPQGRQPSHSRVLGWVGPAPLPTLLPGLPRNLWQTSQLSRLAFAPSPGLFLSPDAQTLLVLSQFNVKYFYYAIF